MWRHVSGHMSPKQGSMPAMYTAGMQHVVENMAVHSRSTQSVAWHMVASAAHSRQQVLALGWAGAGELACSFRLRGAQVWVVHSKTQHRCNVPQHGHLQQVTAQHCAPGSFSSRTVSITCMGNNRGSPAGDTTCTTPQGTLVQTQLGKS
jgi:hypothetical protein